MNKDRYLVEGADALGDVELLALLIEARGGRRAMSIAAELYERAGGLWGLARMMPQEWADIEGIGDLRAVRVHAAIELGRRALQAPISSEPISDASQAYAVLGSRLRGLAEEELVGLFLDRRHRPIAVRRLTHGSDALTVVDPRQIYRVAVAVGACGVILAHNHPSGDPTPSPQDREVTLRVAQAGRILGVPLLDHLVCGAGSYVSLGSPFGASSNGRWYVDDRDERSLSAIGPPNGRPQASRSG